MNNNKCLNPQCEMTIFARGLCHSCYVAARRLINKGMITDEELVKRGKLLTSTVIKTKKKQREDWLMH